MAQSISQNGGFVWTPDDAATFCALCSAVFGVFNRKHHCRKCGKICCNKCTPFRMKVPEHGFTTRVRVCTKCCHESVQAPKLPTLMSHEQHETYIVPLKGEDPYHPSLLKTSPTSSPVPPPRSSRHSLSLPNPSDVNHASLSSIPSLPPVSPHRSLAPTHQSQPLPSRAKSMIFSHAPPPPSQALRPSQSASSLASSLPISPPSPDIQSTLPSNWENLEPIHIGPQPTNSVQYQIPVGSKVVELPGNFAAIYRGLKGFSYKPATDNPIPLNITIPYVPARTLAAHADDHAAQGNANATHANGNAAHADEYAARAIIKTGPALCMAPGSQNWVRGVLCVDATQVSWRGREGETQAFAVTADAVLVPVDRGGQVKGVVSKADGILGIADRMASPDAKDNAQAPRTIWYFHFPSREVRNTWRFSMTFNIAQSLSNSLQFEKVRMEFIQVLKEQGVGEVGEWDWKSILDELYSDDY